MTFKGLRGARPGREVTVAMPVAVVVAVPVPAVAIAIAIAIIVVAIPIAIAVVAVPVPVVIAIPVVIADAANTVAKLVRRHRNNQVRKSEVEAVKKFGHSIGLRIRTTTMMVIDDDS